MIPTTAAYDSANLAMTTTMPIASSESPNQMHMTPMGRMSAEDVDMLARSLPAVVCDLAGRVAAADDHGSRIVLAANGIFLEHRNPALTCRVQVGVWEGWMPGVFGHLEEECRLNGASIEAAMLDEFIAHAMQHCPLEAAGAIVLDIDSGHTRLALHAASVREPGHIKYQVDILPNEMILLDIHSHGRYAAGFSPDDDRDEQGVGLAMVVGNVDKQAKSFAIRLSVCGVRRNVELVGADCARGRVYEVSVVG